MKIYDRQLSGKATCAELYGKFLKCLNLLSNGEVVKKTASDFIEGACWTIADKNWIIFFCLLVLKIQIQMSTLTSSDFGELKTGGPLGLLAVDIMHQRLRRSLIHCLPQL